MLHESFIQAVALCRAAGVEVNDEFVREGGAGADNTMVYLLLIAGIKLADADAFGRYIAEKVAVQMDALSR